MTELNINIRENTKENIINTYKRLIIKMSSMDESEVLKEHIDLKEYIDVLSLKELKTCYMWERKYLKKLREVFPDIIIPTSKKLKKDDNEFYELFTRDIEFDLERNKLLKEINAINEYISLIKDPNYNDALSNYCEVDKLSCSKKTYQSNAFLDKYYQRDELGNIVFDKSDKPVSNLSEELYNIANSMENKESKLLTLELLLHEKKLCLQDAYKEYKNYYINKPYNQWGLKAKEKLHNTLLAIMCKTLKFDIDVQKEDEFTPMFGNKRNFVNLDYQRKIKVSSFAKRLQGKLKEPVIYAANHTNVHDVPVICKAIKEHVHVIAGDEVRNDINGLVFTLNGVDWVSRANEKSRFLAKEASIRRTCNDLSYLYLPEGTWNTTESELMLPFNWGIIDNAQKCGHPIVPVVLEYTDDVCYVKIGSPIYISIYDDKLEAINKLRDTMATMRWQIWEYLSVDIMTKEQEERKERLESIGMKFDSNEKTISWKLGINLLKNYIQSYEKYSIDDDFKTKDGFSYSDDGYELGIWVNSQLKELSQDNLSNLQLLRKKELKDLGIEFKKSLSDKSDWDEYLKVCYPNELSGDNLEITWDDYFKLYKRFKEKYGFDAEPTKSFNTFDGERYNEFGLELGVWVENQRSELSRLTKRITKEQFYNDVINKAFNEYEKINPEFEETVIFRPYTQNEKAFEHLELIEPNINNAWLLNKNLTGLKEEKELVRVKNKK